MSGGFLVAAKGRRTVHKRPPPQDVGPANQNPSMSFESIHMTPKTRAPTKSERITLRLRPDQLTALQTIVDLGQVDSISSAVREAVRDYIRNKVPQAPSLKAATDNLAELGKLSLEQMVQMSVAAALKKQRKELSQP